MDDVVERVLARVQWVRLGIDDHDGFSFAIMFDGAGWGQGTGDMGLPDNARPFLRRLVESFGVRSWDSIKGTAVWVERTHVKLSAWENLEINPGFRFHLKDEWDRAEGLDIPF